MVYLAGDELSREHAVLPEVRGDRLRVCYRVIIRVHSGVFFGESDSTVGPAPIAVPVANL